MKKNLLTIWVKRAVPALALAGVAGLTLPSCEKEPVEKKPVYRAPYEKELFFKQGKLDSVQEPVVKKYVDDTACKHIYLTVMDDNDFTGYSRESVESLHRFLQQRIELSNNISGRGDFMFRTGLANESDSIWFVQNGWTINQLANHR
ncbi:MAG: hypothetical protein K2M92_02225 [Bacteroidales bacterium]|nr:hypothetical protein [Bacteroidales bacterium]